MKSLPYKLATQLGKTLRDVAEIPNIIIQSCDDALKTIGNKQFDKWYETAKTNAMLDPQYAEIEKLRKDPKSPNTIMIDDKKGLGLEQLEYQHQILHKTPQPLFMPIYRYLSNNPINTIINNTKHAYQRLTRSWDDTATWSLDHHLCLTLGNQLKHLSETTHGWPQSKTYPTFEHWQTALNINGDMLIAYANKEHLIYTQDNKYNTELEKQLTKNAQKALRWTATNLQSLWD